MSRRILLFIAVIALLAGTAQAQTLLIADQDNTLFEVPADDGSAGSSDVSNGAGPHLFTGNATALRRALVRFDTSAIAPGTPVLNATLLLTMDRSIVGDTDVAVHRVTAAWGEGASDSSVDGGGGGGGGTGAPAQTGDATWRHTFFDSDFWTTEGGDFVAAPSAIQTIGGVGNYQWETAGLAADVQAWIDDPSSNHGWILVGDESDIDTFSAKRWISREGTLETALGAPDQPTLVLSLGTPAAEIPTMSQWGLLAMGLLLAGFAFYRLRRLDA
ncbi:MAG: IPTL-CTERM sorting domain-containing protein [Acidobacteriota bacterium]